MHPLLSELGQLALQNISTNLLFFGSNFITLVFAGTYTFAGGDESTIFTGVSLANTFATVTCFSITLGLVGAADTLCSDYNGKADYPQVGLVLLRLVTIAWTLMLPMAFLWYHAGALFALVGVESAVCATTQRYLRIRLDALAIEVFGLCYDHYLTAIGTPWPSTLGGIVQIVVLCALNAICVWVRHDSYETLAWNWCLSVVVACGVKVACSWRLPNVARTMAVQVSLANAFSEWSVIFRFAWQGVLMECSEMWAYEIVTLMAAHMSTKDAAVQSIVVQVIAMNFMIPLGIGMAASSKIGNAIGAKQVALAKEVANTTIALTLGVQVVVSIALGIGAAGLVPLFTHDAVVYAKTVVALRYVAVFILFDGMQCVMSGILRGSGNQTLGAIANAVAFYAVALPCAYGLAFRGAMGVNGLILGLTAGPLAQCVILSSCLWYYDAVLYESKLVDARVQSVPRVPTYGTIV